jgi:hypothetical protein
MHFRQMQLDQNRSILDAFGIICTCHALEQKASQRCYEKALKEIGSHIDDEADDDATVAFLEMSGVDLPHIKKVMDIHNLTIRCNTIKRMHRLCKQPSQSTRFKRQISYDNIIQSHPV